MNHKVLIIGLDGATFNVLQPFIDEGLLPNIKSMMDRGIYGTLNSTIPPISPPAWASFMTGKNPGKHGVLHFSSIEDMESVGANLHAGRVVGYRSIKTSTMFDIFRQSSKRLVSINLPLTYPPPETNGIVISDWLTPPDTEVFTYPPELSKDLGEYRIDQYFGGDRFAVVPDDIQRQSERMFTDLTDVLVKRKRTALRLMKESAWDLFFVCFTETDRVQHFFWRAINPAYPGYESPEINAERDLFKKFFREVDTAVGELMAEAGDEVTTIVVSDHGFTSPPQKRFFINYWLKQQGLFGEREGTYKRFYDWLSTHPVAPFVTKLFNKTIRQALRPVREGMPTSNRSLREFETIGVGLSNNWGGIFIHDKEPKKRNEIVAFLKTNLINIRDPRTRSRIVENVYDGDDLYSGPSRDVLPDIVVKLNPNYEFGYEGGIDTIEKDLISHVPPYPSGRGNHKREGVYFVSGPSVASRGRGHDYSIEDIVPTALYLLDVPIPHDTDGKPLPECFDPATSAKYGPPIVKKDPVVEPGNGEALVREKLKHLGYL